MANWRCGGVGFVERVYRGLTERFARRHAAGREADVVETVVVVRD